MKIETKSSNGFIFHASEQGNIGKLSVYEPAQAHDYMIKQMGIISQYQTGCFI